MNQTEMDLYRLFQFNEVSSYMTTMHKIDDESIILDNFEVEFKYNKLNLRNIINNKLILKEGYYSCSYLLYNQELKQIQLTHPIKSKNKKGYPLEKSKNDYSNIIINDKIIGNIKNNKIDNKEIIGVIYYYTPKLEENKENLYYVIDIIYYSNLTNSDNNFGLNYIFYDKKINLKIKNNTVNITDLLPFLEKNTYLNMNYTNDNKLDLLYNSFKKHIDNKLEIQNCIKNAGNKISVLQTLNTDEICDNIRFIISLNQINKEEMLDDQNKIKPSICIVKTNDNSKFSKYIKDINKILDFRQKIFNNIELINLNINNVKNIYLKFVRDIHKISSNDYINFIINETEFNKFSYKFKNMIEMRGYTNDSPDKTTIYGYKNNIYKLYQEIKLYIINLNELVLKLKETMDVNIIKIIEKIDILFSNIKKYNNVAESNRNIVNTSPCKAEILQTIN